MGGTAVLAKSGVESTRLTLSEFDRVQSAVISTLRELGIRSLTIPFIKSKTDFGDIDIIVIDERIDKMDNNTCLSIIHDNIDKFFCNDDLYIKNGDVVSILYEGKYQIDFIKVNADVAQYTQAYLSHNDLGNLLGRCIKRFNVTHAMDGLFYDHYMNNKAHRTRFLLSNDPHQVLRILGLDIEKFKSGFNTYEEMFDYVMSSKYFNPELFKFENLNNRNRVRDRKRKVYNMFLDYINYDFKNDNVYDVVADYPWIPAKCEEYTTEYNRRAAIRNAIPGPVVIERTGLTGKELGSFIHYVKEKYQDELIGMTEEQLHNVIDASFASYKV